MPFERAEFILQVISEERNMNKEMKASEPWVHDPYLLEYFLVSYYKYVYEFSRNCVKDRKEVM
jgi:hypothetical protein